MQTKKPFLLNGWFTDLTVTCLVIFYCPDKVQSTASKYEVWRKVMQAFRNSDCLEKVFHFV